jgi:hypothetical protein
MTSYIITRPDEPEFVFITRSAEHVSFAVDTWVLAGADPLAINVAILDHDDAGQLVGVEREPGLCWLTVEVPA